MRNAPLPEDHHVTRYCKPTTVADAGLPTVSAFQLRLDEEYLSVNWLEYFGKLELNASLQRVRSEVAKSLALSPNGRFAVLNVGATKTTVLYQSLRMKS